MKYKLQAFFSGRNGIDELGKALLWGAVILLLISSVLGLSILYIVSLAIFLYADIRAFSRNLEKCQKQNAAFLSRRNFRKLRFQQRKTHKFYRCPKCKQQLRVPRGKGKISITCKSCGERFVKKT